MFGRTGPVILQPFVLKNQNIRRVEQEDGVTRSPSPHARWAGELERRLQSATEVGFNSPPPLKCAPDGVQWFPIVSPPMRPNNP